MSLVPYAANYYNKRKRKYYDTHTKPSYSVKKFAAQSSGAALGFITANVPGAVVGGYAAGEVVDYIDSTPLPTKMSKSSGFYKGSIGKARHFKATSEIVALQKGFHSVFDTYGRVTDPQAVYIIHGTWKALAIAEVICGSLIRKLFQKAGVQINERTEELPLVSISVATGFRLEFTHQNAVNAAGTTVTYDTVDDDTLQTVINNFTGLSAFFINYLNNVTVASEPFRLSLYSSDSATWRIASTLNLANEQMNLFLSSELNMQNRTQGDTAAAGDLTIERTDNQPLICKMYEFNHSDPRLRQNGANTDELNTGGQAGIKLIRATTLPATFQHRPSPKIWANCKGTSQFILDPGNLKKTFVSWKSSGLLINVLKKLKCYVTNLFGVSGAPGKCQVVMFEEKLRTAGTNPVTIQYEHVHKAGCWFVTKSGGSLHSSYAESVANLP